MKLIFTFIASILFIQCFSQGESEQNYVLNSVSLSTDSFATAVIEANYFTLKNNIDNKASSAYIAGKPSLDQILDTAINLPSDFFLINKAGTLLNMIKLENKPNRRFLILTPPYMERKEIKCSLKGDISENRAAELIKEKYDPNARIEEHTLYFNNKKLKIISNEQIKAKLHELIKNEKLTEPTLSNVKILSQIELRTLILAQTRKGGKLDFFTSIKGQEYSPAEVKPGVHTTKICGALYSWGKEVADLGVSSPDEAIEIYTQFRGEEPGEREKGYISMGFKKVLEK